MENNYPICLKKKRNRKVKYTQFDMPGFKPEHIGMSIASDHEAASVIRSWYTPDLLQEREVFGIMTLSRQGKITGHSIVSIGSISSTIVWMPAIMKVMLSTPRTESAIVFHNHPSGSLTASDCDIKVTKQIKEAFSIMDYRLLDHLIVTDKNHESIISI